MAERGVNKVILIGRLGKKPEGGTGKNGEKWCSFSLATNEVWLDKATNEKMTRTEWHKISIFGALADICLKYLDKGSQVYLEGMNRTRKWSDDKGVDRWTTEVLCHNMQMLGGKQEGSQSAHEPRPQPESRQGAAVGGGDGSNTRDQKEDFDDDIPFVTAYDFRF